MLKPADPQQQPPERPVGEVVHDLIEGGKAYARAELGVAKAVAAAKARALALPAGLFGAAFALVQAAITALAVGVFAALYWAFGPILAGLVAFLIFSALAGALAWYAVHRLKRDL
ncbi:phage holin family protein [Sphingomonas lutea]|uniref:Phage holin family protein n=1 Tax=Sphingomonas lutea TaxID=1045317 RepID=A0A7G9SFG0_9SPHN|nr:phage holin family protein [Sphingomonas lutea]QNN66585.1 phage holin family protein [Sphingomonas lutea]